MIAIKKSEHRSSASASSPRLGAHEQSGAKCYAAIRKFQVISVSLIRFTVGLPPPFFSSSAASLSSKASSPSSLGIPMPRQSHGHRCFNPDQGHHRQLETSLSPP